ncbi:MAG TPA: hypothetical protein DEH22_17495 [Chloroflexi bacterium]|nr:hypothetical protein [Chloroflexota bacterium]
MTTNQSFNLRQAIWSRLNNKGFLQNSGLLLLANMIVIGLGLIRTPAITWFIPKDQVGMIGVVASWLPFARLLSYPGLDFASYHYMSKGESWAFVINLRYRIKWSLLSGALLLVGAVYWLQRGETMLAWIFLISGLFFPVTNGLTATAGALGSREQYKDLFWYRIFESITDFAGFIPLLFSSWWLSQVVTFYGANQLATAIMLIVYGIWIWKQLHDENTPVLSADDEREMLRYGKHQTALNTISILQTRTDAFLVGALLPLTTMADYSIALMVYEQFKRLWNIYVTVRYPRLVRLPIVRQQQRFFLEGCLVWVGFIMMGVFISALAHWLIPIILPAEYASSLGYMDILIATAVITIPGGFAELYFRMQQDEKKQYYMRVLSAIVGVIAPALFVIRWGAYGAAAGRLIAGLILSIAGIWLFTVEVKRTKITN